MCYFCYSKLIIVTVEYVIFDTNGFVLCGDDKIDCILLALFFGEFGNLCLQMFVANQKFSMEWSRIYFLYFILQSLHTTLCLHIYSSDMTCHQLPYMSSNSYTLLFCTSSYHSLRAGIVDCIYYKLDRSLFYLDAIFGIMIINVIISCIFGGGVTLGIIDVPIAADNALIGFDFVQTNFVTFRWTCPDFTKKFLTTTIVTFGIGAALYGLIFCCAAAIFVACLASAGAVGYGGFGFEYGVADGIDIDLILFTFGQAFNVAMFKKIFGTRLYLFGYVMFGIMIINIVLSCIRVGIGVILGIVG